MALRQQWRRGRPLLYSLAARCGIMRSSRRRTGLVWLWCLPGCGIFGIRPDKKKEALLLGKRGKDFSSWRASCELNGCVNPQRGGTRMLELRPNCECCDRDLPPSSLDARICTFECTFCATCADDLLAGTCPNCGGNLVARPIRPANLLGKAPASTKRVFKRNGCAQHVA